MIFFKVMKPIRSWHNEVLAGIVSVENIGIISYSRSRTLSAVLCAECVIATHWGR